MKQDEPGSCMYFIRKGECAVLKRLEFTVTVRVKVIKNIMLTITARKNCQVH